MVICALILAGGRSSRFGREKAAAELGGRPLIAWVADVLAQGSDHLAVNAPPGSAADAFAMRRALPCRPDAPTLHPGPLAGLRAGLRWAREMNADWLATAPCDLPFLPRNLLSKLVNGRSAGGAVACPPGGLQPLCSLWPVSALDLLETFQGHPPIRQLLDQLNAARVVFDEDAAFANLNTVAEFAEAEASIASPHKTKGEASTGAPRPCPSTGSGCNR